MMDMKQLAKEQEQYVIDCRRWLHAHPEVGEQEFETTKFIIAELEKNLPLQVRFFCFSCITCV